MKPGSRALGIAESFRGSDHQADRRTHRADRSTLAGAVVRADRVVDGLEYGVCTIGGTDGTAAVCSLIDEVARPDVRYVLLGAIAPAWYNLLDLARIHKRADRPVVAVTFEASEGLEAGLRDAFAGEALDRRLQTYRSLPDRNIVSVNDETVYVRAVGCDESKAREIVRSFTPAGGRPEPLRVARMAARAADEYAGDRQ